MRRMLVSCHACGRQLIQAQKGRPRLYCNKTCASRAFHRVNRGYRKEAYKKMYANHAERERERARRYYWKTKNLEVKLPKVPVRFSPNFSSYGDPYGLLADYELRHLLADFEDEEGDL